MLLVQRQSAGSVGRAVAAAHRLRGASLRGQWYAVTLLLDGAEEVAPSLHGVLSSVELVQQLMRASARVAPQLVMVTGGVQSASVTGCEAAASAV